jgi:pseudouridine-5'-phosphate glycosidase
MHSSLQTTPEVRDALANGQPVVALESTLIAHGLPWPENLETARDSEAAVRQSGSVAATMAVIGGVIRIGLTDEELELLAKAPRNTIVKAARRDLGIVVARGLNAATTVSATLWIAQQAGIGTMATGGLGGVHRGASESFDISMDLDELARADGMLVVCSGVKSILDVAATLEAMETRGTLVVGYRTSTFPGFTSSYSALLLEWQADSPSEVAAIVLRHRQLGLPAAILLAQTVPLEVAIGSQEMDQAITTALAAARDRGISGKEITPFLLDAVQKATEGRSLIANRALIVANARLAGEVAANLAG